MQQTVGEVEDQLQRSQNSMSVISADTSETESFDANSNSNYYENWNMKLRDENKKLRYELNQTRKEFRKRLGRFYGEEQTGQQLPMQE